MKSKRLAPFKNTLWFNIFVRVAVIFVFFVAVISILNFTALEGFFIRKQKGILLEQMSTIENIDTSDSNSIRNALSEISDTHSIDAEIYDQSGKILYTTHGPQMMDFINEGKGKFVMQHEELYPDKRTDLGDGTVFEEASHAFNNQKFLLCRKQIDDGIYAELRIQRSLVSNSAKTATEFIGIIAVVCFLLSLIWVVVFAKKFSAPLVVMNEISGDMANLNFDRKLEVSSKDEIGQLASSINRMSDSLSCALSELRQSNAKLKDEIELERSLDNMRKTFVANVSHELKTPISIISGYAEGLKLNVNSDSREKYCDIIIDESKRMNSLVLGILKLSRYESGQIPLNKECFDIAAAAKDLALRIFKHSDIKVDLNISEGTQVFADKTQTEQIIKVFLENALSHTPKDGKVSVFANQNADKIRIFVENTGSHINEEDMPKIWQSFYRGDTSHKRDEGRFGLGLSIVGALCRQHGCDCGVYNTALGVCFWFELETAP